MNLNVLRNCWILCGLAAAGLFNSIAFAQEGSELVGLINAFRSERQSCQGKRIDSGGPLAPDAALARVKPGAGRNLLEAVKDQGYLAARVEVIRISGPADAVAAMKLISTRYCQQLLSQQYAQIGVARTDVTWQILLARPLVSAELGQWGQAGQEILRLTNSARAQARTCGDQRFSAAPPLAWIPDLGAAALAHSRDMAKRNYFRHVGKNGSEVGDRASAQGYRWRRVGENIAAGQGSAEQAVSAWLSSPPHCANMMRPEFAEMGAAFAVNPNSDSTIYLTQVFGTR
jgi:uncharacterized protein YkwD